MEARAVRGSAAARLAGPGFRSLGPAPLPRCPAGHDVFHVAVALALAADGAVRGITVGLWCPEDGASCLYVDDARVVATAEV